MGYGDGIECGGGGSAGGREGDGRAQQYELTAASTHMVTIYGKSPPQPCHLDMTDT